MVTIAKIEGCRVEAHRPRIAGSNARLGVHGKVIGVPLARITLSDGTQGFGSCHASKEKAEALLSKNFAELFTPETGTAPDYRAFDFPLWDLAGQITGLPVYALLGGPPDQPLSVPCYDTSLYFDDLHLTDDNAAADLLATEAHEGYEKGHRAFKIKVGRGGRHMPLEAGTRRDLLVIRAVRDAVGPHPPILLDANNGWNLNLTKHVLRETTDIGIFWMEEAFHEDAELYRDLKNWLRDKNIPTLLADGEGQASPTLLDWARNGLVDVIQYDVFGYGFTPWLHLGKQLDNDNIRSAPHHYGAFLGNYVSGHLAAAVSGFTFVEWDEAQTPMVDTSAYRVTEGNVLLPHLPGFGLHLDSDAFQTAVQSHGWTVS